MTRQTRRTFLKTSGALLGAMAAGTTVTAATSTGRFIVDKRTITGSGVERSDLTVVHDIDAIDLVVVEGSRSDVRALGANFAPDTTYRLDLPAESVPIRDTSETTDEPLYPIQWDKQALNVPDAHEITRGEDTRVAVIDSGVDPGHPDLAGVVNTALSRDFTGDGYGVGGPYGGYHGSQVSSIIAADDGNDLGVVGTAPGTEIVDCRVFTFGSLANFSDVLAAMVYSASIDSDVANLSLGAYPFERQDIGRFYGKALNRATAYAKSQGTLLVVAIGNDTTDLRFDANLISLPDEAANVVTVAATSTIGFGWGEPGLEKPPYGPTFYTNYGTSVVDLAAPGGSLDLDAVGTGVAWYLDMIIGVTSYPVFDDDGTYLGADRTWSWAAGTSMAAPQVSGAAALVKSVNPGYNPGQIRSTLERTASVPAEYEKAYYGSGFLDPNAAVRD